MRFNIYISLIFLIFKTATALAFPEMIRHGYVNCTACHLSPAGGGLLTEYGQSLSKELLTYQSGSLPKKNPDVKPQTNLFGGDFRVLEFYLNNDFRSAAQFIPMNAHVEAAFNEENYAFVGRMGLVNIGRGEAGEGSYSQNRNAEAGEGSANTNAFLPTLYGLYRFAETWNIRAGIFMPSYGLNNSMHFIGTRGPMGFGFQDQRPGLEISRLGESLGALVSIYAPRGPNLGKNSYSAQLQYSPTDSSKIALNYWKEADLRTIYGLWAVFPVVGATYLTTDLNQVTLSNGRNGYFYYAKFGFEKKQGLHFYLMYDSSQLDTTLSYTQVNRIGPGVQMFPIHHFEIDVAWLKEQNKLFATQDGDYAYLLLHYYL